MDGRIREVLDKAYIPESADEVIEQVSQSEVYESIYNYYDDDDKFIQPISYEISSPEGDRKVKTTLGCIPNESLDINSVEYSNIFFSTYSEEAMRELGIDTDDVWNGEIAPLMYTYNGTLQFADTDYYTKSMFSRIPYLESCNAVYNNNDMTPGRDMLISDVSDFNDRPGYCTGGTLGGVLIGKNEDDNYEIILGERSQDPIINKGRISVIPNGLIKPKQLKSSGIRTSAKKQFTEELFGYKKSGESFFEDNIKTINLINGWNLRDASISIYYGFIIEDKEEYTNFTSKMEENMEFENLIRIEIEDYKSVMNYVKFDKMSPSTIPAVLEGIRYVSDKNGGYDYEIKKLL